MSRQVTYTVGQTVYLMSPQGLRPVTVTKVGNKWAYLGGRDRVAIDSAVTAHTNGVGKEVYASPEQYAEEKDLETAWRNVQEHARNNLRSLPIGVTTENIRQALALLGWKEKP